MSLWNKFKAGVKGTYLIATGSAVGRIASLAMIGLAFGGIGAITPPIAAVGLVTLAAGVAVDVIRVRSLRRLRIEYEHLMKNRRAKDMQNYLLDKVAPNLKQILSENLIKLPIEIEHKQPKYTTQNTKHLKKYKIFGQSLARSAEKTGSIIQNILTKNPLGLAQNIVTGVASFVGLTMDNINTEQLKDHFKSTIDEERIKSDTPSYTSLRELKYNSDQQRIQTLALQKLLCNENFKNMSPEEIITEFQSIKNSITVKQNSFNRNQTLGQRFKYFVKSVGRDFLTVHNPFSAYNHLKNLQVKVADKMSRDEEHYTKDNFIKKISSNMRANTDREYVKEADHSTLKQSREIASNIPPIIHIMENPALSEVSSKSMVAKEIQKREISKNQEPVRTKGN